MKKIVTFLFVVILGLCHVFTGCNLKNDSSYDNQNYEISNSYFSIASYEPHTYTTINLQGGGTTYQYVLTCSSTCTVSLYEYTAEVKLYSSNNTLLDTQIITKKKAISANTTFSFDVEVSRQIQLQTTSIDVVFSGKSNEKPKQIEQTYQITLVYNNGTTNKKVVVEKGKTLPTPNEPKKTNYTFSGWYIDPSLTNKYDFSKTVTQNFALYAKYEIDALTITNKISKDSIKAIVKIYNKNYDTFLGIETSSSTSQGSGFCFHIQDGYYYILTNCHVAKKNSAYDKQKITIEDYQGKTYTGYLYQNSNKLMSAISASYDLACLYFKPTSTNVQKLSLATSNPEKDQDIISIGAPQGQSNSITYGKIINYQTIKLSNTSTSLSNVTFDVICHNAYANSGSSGGPLLNANLNVVGVHYAGSKSANLEYAIPAVKVQEFLRTYVYN